MEIISYSKTKKANSSIQAINERLGHTDKFRYGGKDIKDIYVNTDERIQELELKITPIVINNDISKISSNTQSNLAKHEVKTNGLLNASKFNHHKLIYNGLISNSGFSLSNCTYDSSNKTIKPSSSSVVGTVTFDSVSTSANQICLHLGYDGYFSEEKTISISGVTDNTDILNGSISLSKDGEYYKDLGSFVTDVIDLGENFENLNKIETSKSIPTQSVLNCFISESEDGVNFGGYNSFSIDLEYDKGVFKKRYIKLKFEFIPGKTDVTSKLTAFSSDDSTDFSADKDFTFNSSGLSYTPLSENSRAIIKGSKDYEIKELQKINVNVAYKTFTSENFINEASMWGENINKDSSVYNLTNNKFCGEKPSGTSSTCFLRSKSFTFNDLKEMSVILKFNNPRIINKISTYYLYGTDTKNSARSPEEVIIYGSADGDVWNYIDGRYIYHDYKTWRTTTFSNTQDYKYYKFTFRNRRTSVIFFVINKLEVYGPVPKTGNLRVALSSDSGETWFGQNGIISINDTSDFYSKGYTTSQLSSLDADYLKKEFSSGKIRIALLIEEFQSSMSTVTVKSLEIISKKGTSTPQLNSLKAIVHSNKETSKPKAFVSLNGGSVYKEINFDGTPNDISNLISTNSLKIKIELSKETMRCISYSWI